jgi:hypothetical protein
MASRFTLPDRCSLVQAALWVARKQRPLADDLFDAAPLWLEKAEVKGGGPLRPLLQALRSGEIPAWADAILETAPPPDGLDWKVRHRARDIDVPLDCWNWRNVDWQQSRVSCSVNILEMLRLKMPPGPDGDEMDALVRAAEMAELIGDAQRFSLHRVRVDVGKLITTFPDAAAVVLCSGEEQFPPYLHFMVSALRQLGPQDQRLPKKRVESWLEKNWPDGLGPRSASKISYMATFLRHPKDEKGGHFRPQRKK